MSKTQTQLAYTVYITSVSEKLSARGLCSKAVNYFVFFFQSVAW